MKCPHCHNVQKLTMLKYYRAPSGRYVCSSCGRRFELRQSALNMVTTILTCALTVFMPAGLVYFSTRSLWMTALSWIICCFLLYFPIGKFLDERRETRPSAQ